MHKILLIIPSFRGGGAERVFIDLAILLDEKGYDVTLAALSAEGEYRRGLPDHLSVQIFGRGGVRSSFIPLVRLIKSFKADVVISALTHLNIAVVAANIVAGKCSKVVVTEHNHFAAEKGGLQSLKRCSMYIGSWLAYRNCHRVVAVSTGVKRSLIESLRLNDSRVDVIFNAIDVERIERLSKAPSPYYIGPQTITTMGRLVPQKRYDVLLNAFALVRSQNKSARLVVLGDGPLREELENLAKRLNIYDHVDFLGFLDNPFPIIASSSVFVLSSDFEGFGNVLVEALAVGLPVVSTNCETGPSEILADGKYGLLAATGNPQSISTCIESVLSEEKKFHSDELIRRANDFSPENAYLSFEALFKALEL